MFFDLNLSYENLTLTLVHFFTDLALHQRFSNFFKISTLRSPKIFSIAYGPFFKHKFPRKIKRKVKKKVIASAVVQQAEFNEIIYQKSAIRDLFKIPLKLLRGPQFENHCFKP